MPHNGIANWTAGNVGVDGPGNLYVALGVGNTVQLIRFRAADGTRDDSFGAGNASVSLPQAMPSAQATGTISALWRSISGSWVVLDSLTETTGGFFPSTLAQRLLAARFLADGTPDPGFTQGTVIASGHAQSNAANQGVVKVARTSNGELALLSDATGTCTEKRLLADLPADNAMVEYYNARLDHYFMTVEGAEALGLDTTAAGTDWKRTGRAFGTWLPSELAGTTKLCRFYGDLKGGPDSHFYTPEGAECQFLRELEAATPIGQYAWRFEGYAGNVAVPTDGQCASNLSPVYRLYNKGYEKGGVPNHRYTTDVLLYREMQDQEGWAGEGVVFCVPPEPMKSSTLEH
jgi:hypothetical protein